MHLTIDALWLYPVKSLAGIRVSQWPVTPLGLLYDRQYVIINSTGRFLSQRQLPQMALVGTAINDGELTLSCLDHGSVSLPLEPEDSGETTPATIWRDTVAAVEPSKEASRWLTKVLASDTPLRLVKLADNEQRPQSQPERFGSDTHTQFADAAPFLTAFQSSLDRLNERLLDDGIETVDMRRFRPNLVLSGLDEAFAEHQLQSMHRVEDDMAFALIDHCQRCIMTTIDPDTAVKHPNMEPHDTVAKLNPMPGKPRAAAFGVNATLSAAGDSMLKVGDRFEVQLKT